MDQYFSNSSLPDDNSSISENEHRGRRDHRSRRSNIAAHPPSDGFSSFSELLGMSQELEEEMHQFVKSQRIKEWARHFRRSDPRYQILNFFNDVAQEGASHMEKLGVSLPTISPLLRAFYKSSVFTVWRPTSYDAIRRMMLGEGVGKGLDIKGKSAKKGRLSGFVPFLQIHQEKHKTEIRTLPKDGKLRVFYNSKEDREKVVSCLEAVAKEMINTVKDAKKIVEDESQDDETNEWALTKLTWDMTDSSINLIQDYEPKLYGIEIAERLFWEGLVIRQDIHREPESPDDTGRPSEPNFQNMNFAALRPHDKPDDENPCHAVILQYDDPNEDNQDPLNPRDLLMAYEESELGRVMPVVSDFDCFIVGTRGVKYEEPLPDDQLDVSKWSIEQIESILESGATTASWTSRWLEILKNSASKGYYPKSPPMGFSDPKSQSIMMHAIQRLAKEGAVRHGAECFNYSFPQELDDEFLVISDRLEGQTLPWKYVDKEGLQEILKKQIDLGYTFPLNSKWILCDPGWKDVFDKLKASEAPYVQDSLKVWYPPESGILEKIEEVHKRFPNGFQRKIASNPREMSNAFDDTDGTAAMDLAELELKYFLTLQRAKRKLRGFLIWRRLLDDRRKIVKDPEKVRMNRQLSQREES